MCFCMVVGVPEFLHAGWFCLCVSGWLCLCMVDPRCCVCVHVEWLVLSVSW